MRTAGFIQADTVETMVMLLAISAAPQLPQNLIPARLSLPT
jgi:hypothetical protein